MATKLPVEYNAGQLEVHGYEFQRQVAWILLQKLILEGRDFDMAFEMKAAGNFDDICILIDGAWFLIQTKHCQPEDKEKNTTITEESFFVGKKDNKQFLLLKYLNAYNTMKQNWNFGNIENLIIFTNRKLGNDTEKSPYEKINNLFVFSKGEHIKLDKHVKYKEKILENITGTDNQMKKEIVEEFFSKLVLSVDQPNVEELKNEMIQEGLIWMRKWIHPDDLGRMDETFFEIPLNIIKEKFSEYEKLNLKRNAEGSIIKTNKFLQKSYGEEILQKIKATLIKEIQKGSNRPCASLNAINEYYISRQIAYFERSALRKPNKVISEGKLVNQLVVTNYENKDSTFSSDCYVLTAQSGMGKSIFMQYLAFETQKRNPKLTVFLIYLNNLQGVVPEIDTLDDLLELKVFQSELSIKNTELLVKESDSKIILFFDALDELSDQNQNTFLKIIILLAIKKNVECVISSIQKLNNNIKTSLENNISVMLMELLPFNFNDQKRFFKKFWKMPKNTPKLRTFIEKLLIKIHSDISRKRFKFTATPQMIRMVADIYDEPFQKHLRLDIDFQHVIPNEKTSVIDLHEQFARKYIKINMINELLTGELVFPPDFKPFIKNVSIFQELN